MKVGSAWVVGRVSSKQPPWSTAMSTSTLPGFIRETRALLTSFGALAPGTSTEPITRSALDRRSLDLEAVRRDRAHPAGVEGVELAQPLHVGVEHGDVGAEPDADRDGVGAGHAAAEHDDARRMRAGNARA